MNESSLFNRQRLEEIMDVFLIELDKRGVKGTILLVGGAALSLYYFDRESTLDIDAALPNDSRVTEVIKEIAIREKLPVNWINSDASMYFGFPPSSFWITKQQVGDITLKVASAELLIAMKLKAARGRRDNEDIVELFRILKIQEIEQVEQIYETIYAQETIPDSSRELLLSLLKANQS
jgi:predicted nucleotidyltransferase component of viral defense system